MKTILIIVAIVIAVPLIIALFVKGEYKIEREIVIDKPRSEVFSYIMYLRNQDKFSKWAQMDPGMKKEYIGTDGTVGFRSTWDSEKKEVGKGEQEIINIVPGEVINTKLHFIKPFHGLADAYMKTETASENTTKVKWGFSSKMPYPMNIMLLFMDMEKMLGKDLEIGLNNLKSIQEK